MAHTYGGAVVARTSSAGNPITFAYTPTDGDTVHALLIKGTGATNRAGGSPTWGDYTFLQANSTQKAAASPEASAEIWYLLNPPTGISKTLTIPNTGAITLKYTLVTGRAKAGCKSALDGAIGGNGTSTNPTPGAIVTTDDGDIVFAITAGGWTTWSPSAQVGTAIANTDDGADGGGEQYSLQAALGSITLGWTFGTSDDWGAVAAAFKEIPANALHNYMVDRLRAGSGMSVAK